MRKSFNPDSKSISVVAGPNGSGKTTFAKSFLSRDKIIPIFLNPDLIAAGISPHNDDQVSFQAGRVLLADIKNRLKNNESFGFESTLSGKTYFSLLKEARSNGYSVVFYFLCVTSVSLSLKRIKTRVKEGGHDIPKSAVLRRQSRCFNNFWNLYRTIADDWYVFDNSGKSPKLLISRNSFQKLDSLSQERFASSFLRGKFNDKKRS